MLKPEMQRDDGNISVEVIRVSPKLEEKVKIVKPKEFSYPNPNDIEVRTEDMPDVSETSVKSLKDSVSDKTSPRRKVEIFDD